MALERMAEWPSPRQGKTGEHSADGGQVALSRLPPQTIRPRGSRAADDPPEMSYLPTISLPPRIPASHRAIMSAFLARASLAEVSP